MYIYSFTRAGSSERRNILALNFERFPMFLKSWETKVDVVVLRGNMKNFGPVSFFSSFFSFLRRNLTIFGGGFGSFDLISRAKKKQKKDQSSLFSYCHEEQLCQFLFTNSPRTMRKNYVLRQTNISIRFVAK